MESWFQPQQIGAGDRNIVSEHILLCHIRYVHSILL